MLLLSMLKRNSCYYCKNTDSINYGKNKIQSLKLGFTRGWLFEYGRELFKHANYHNCGVANCDTLILFNKLNQ